MSRPLIANMTIFVIIGSFVEMGNITKHLHNMSHVSNE